MDDIAFKSLEADKPQIRKIIEDAQRRYRMAMLDMADIYSGISDDINYFGFSPDYVPFPMVDPQKWANPNPFDVMLTITRQKVVFARQREIYAINSNRAFNTDLEAFQAELVRVRNTYENQLADLCGTITVTETVDGVTEEKVR